MFLMKTSTAGSSMATSETMTRVTAAYSDLTLHYTVKPMPTKTTNIHTIIIRAKLIIALFHIEPRPKK